MYVPDVQKPEQFNVNRTVIRTGWTWAFGRVMKTQTPEEHGDGKCSHTGTRILFPKL